MPPPPPPPATGFGLPSLATPAFAGAAGLATPGPVVIATPTPTKRSSEIKWRWPHLWLYGLFAWGIPTAYSSARPNGSFSSFLNLNLAIQLVCYLLAGAVAYVLVHKRHKGDWSTVGLSFSELSYEELLRGGGFGLLMIACWLPLGFLMDGGQVRFDSLVQTLIGGTSGAGLLLAAVVVIIGAPIIEEIYYRGMLYEKFARRSRWLAIVVTSVLFVSAHGALLIPALMILAVGLAWKRQTRGLWYTIGAHAAWNLVVLMMAAFVLLGPARAFSSVDGAVSLHYSADWQRAEEAEVTFPGMSVDLALTGPNGSFMAVTRVDVPTRAGLTPEKAITKTLQGLASIHLTTTQVTPGRVEATTYPIGGGTTAYELRNQIHDSTTGTSGENRQVAVMPPGWTRVLVFQLTCPAVSCTEATPDFEQLLSTTVLAPTK